MACAPTIDESQWKGERIITLRFQCCQTFTERFKLKDIMKNTSAITAVTNSSMKPWSGAATNCHLPGSGERNGEQR